MSAQAILAKLRGEAQTSTELAVLAAIDKALAAPTDPVELVVLGLNLAEARAWAGRGAVGEIIAERDALLAKQTATRKAQQKAAGESFFASDRERFMAGMKWRTRLTDKDDPASRPMREGMPGKARKLLARDAVVLDASTDPPIVGRVSDKTVERTLEWLDQMRDSYAAIIRDKRQDKVACP